MSDTSEDLDVSGDSVPFNNHIGNRRANRYKPYDLRNNIPDKESVSSTANELLTLPDRNYWSDKYYKSYYRSNGNDTGNTSSVSPVSPSIDRTNIGTVLEPLLPLKLPSRNFCFDRECETTCRTNGRNNISSKSPMSSDFSDSANSTSEGWKDPYNERGEEINIRRTLFDELKAKIDAKRLPTNQLYKVLSSALFKECNQDKEKALGKLVSAREDMRRLRLHHYPTNHINVPYNLYRIPHSQISPPASMTSVTSITHQFPTHPRIPQPLRLFGQGYYVENALPRMHYYPVEK